MSEADVILELLAAGGLAGQFSYENRKRDLISFSAFFQKLSNSELEVAFLDTDCPSDPLPIGTKIYIAIFDNEQVYSAASSLQSVRSASQYILEISSSRRSTQKRNFFRIDTTLSFSCEAFNSSWKFTVSGRNLQCNLSGGGIAFLIPYGAFPGETGKITIEVFDSSFQCELEVIRCQQLGPRRYRVACKFIQIAESDREQIIVYCNAEQRRQLKQLSKIRSEVGF